ncbi:MAG TPA: SCO family protein [Blastocatellia bacterium]|nr:SCO family protein [Blastocatellia bacterium]
MGFDNYSLYRRGGRGLVGDASGLTRIIGLILAVVIILGIAGCHKSHPKQYELKGKVVAVDTGLRRVTIAHDAIPGYMDAMTMPYDLKDDWAYSVLKPGDTVNAILVVDSGRSWLQNIVITEETTDDASAGGKTAQPEPKPGDAVPDFSLENQDSQPIHLSQYRDKALVLTFIYTRCPLPDYCPLMSQSFAEIDKSLQKDPALYAKTHLLSITIDPDYDTPVVMRAYGATFAGGNFNHWEFATGSLKEVKAVADYFGLRYWQEKGQIIHALRTAVISPDGKMVKLYRGNEWKPADIIHDLQSIRLD